MCRSIVIIISFSISLSILIVSIIWLLDSGGYEPVVATLTAVATLLTFSLTLMFTQEGREALASIDISEIISSFFQLITIIKFIMLVFLIVIVVSFYNFALAPSDDKNTPTASVATLVTVTIGSSPATLTPTLSVTPLPPTFTEVTLTLTPFEITPSETFLPTVTPSQTIATATPTFTETLPSPSPSATRVRVTNRPSMTPSKTLTSTPAPLECNAQKPLNSEANVPIFTEPGGDLIVGEISGGLSLIIHSQTTLVVDDEEQVWYRLTSDNIDQWVRADDVMTTGRCNNLPLYDDGSGEG